MTLGELYVLLDSLYPSSLSCSWDNDGMMICPNPDRPVRRVLLALDATEASIGFAGSEQCDLLITHHPLLFRPLKCLHPGLLSGKRVIAALQSGVSVFSFHTRLDAGDGGVNDALAQKLRLRVIGKFGDDESPSIGRLAEMDNPMHAEMFAKKVCQDLGCPCVQMTGTRPVQKIALIGGDGKDLIDAAMACGADTLVTGSAGYNAVLDASENGLNILEAGHYYTEAPVLAHLADICRKNEVPDCLFFDSNETKYWAAAEEVSCK